MNEYDWYSLDNAAKIFPAISGNYTSNVYRIDVKLKSAINPVFLEKAVNTVLPSFPAFMVRMRKGLFWYYFEHNFERALVTEEKSYPCSHIDADTNAGYLFRFSYFNNKVSLDVYHALSDGTGTVNFLNEVILCYLKLCGEPVNDYAYESEKSIDFSAMEDSFSKFFSPQLAKRPKKIRAYHLKGTPRAKGNTKVIHGIINTDEFIKIAKSEKVSLTSYITAVLAFSIYKTVSDHVFSRPLRISIPVNLRNFFESVTQRNFFTFITIDIDLNKKEYTFDEILKLASEQMTERLRPECFMPKVNYFLQTEKNIFTRVTPLFIKNLALQFVYRQSGDETYTCTLSNLGKLSVSPSVEKYIERFGCMVGTSSKNHMNCGVCSYKDKFVISFTKSDFETDVEKNFFRFLSSRGLKIILEQN